MIRDCNEGKCEREGKKTDIEAGEGEEKGKE